MKTIQSIQIWIDGSLQTASVMNAYCISDNLVSQAVFYFALFAENADTTLGLQLTQGNLSMTGADYTEYESNQYAWDWIAKQLNLTITGDYVPPTNK
jgi:hypothetical protein